MRGSVPGKAGTFSCIKDTCKIKPGNGDLLNYPTFIPEAGARLSRELIMKPQDTDPFEDYYHDNDVVDRDA